jgi:hypothetical protein
MLLMFWLLLSLLGSSLLLTMPAIRGWRLYRRSQGRRTVTCPETHAPVAVTFDALHVAVTGLRERPAYRLAACTRWPERSDCSQPCIPEALRGLSGS